MQTLLMSSFSEESLVSVSNDRAWTVGAMSRPYKFWGDS